VLAEVIVVVSGDIICCRWGNYLNFTFVVISAVIVVVVVVVVSFVDVYTAVC
jgi:hypothetical protein